MILSLSFENSRKSAAPKRSKSSAEIFEKIPAGGHGFSRGEQPHGGSGGSHGLHGSRGLRGSQGGLSYCGFLRGSHGASSGAGGLRHEPVSSRGGASHPHGSRAVSTQFPASFTHSSCGQGFCISKRLPP